MSFGMHGSKRVEQPPEVMLALKQKELVKVEEYCKISKDYEEKRKNCEHDKAMIDITYQLLILNPDYYSAWNDRRRALEATETSNYKKELELVMVTLKLRPKTYWIWNHRSWALFKMNQKEAWIGELQLTDFLLNLDSRNFHGWNYRRQVIHQLLKHGQEADETLQKELLFTETKIQQSFSNGSAWHYRTTLLDGLDLSKEQNLVKNAFYTDPEDQSAWIYYQWLMTYFGPCATPPMLSPPHCHIFSRMGNSGDILIDLSLTFSEPVSLVNLSVPDHPDLILIHDWEASTSISRVWNSSLKAAQASFPLSFILSPENIKASKQLPVDVKFHTMLDKPLLEKSCSRFVPLGRDILKRLDFNLSIQERLSFLQREYEELQELVDLEPNAKWPLLTQAFLKKEAQVARYRAASFGHQLSDEFLDTKDFFSKAARTLSVIDPLRKEYYSSWS